MNLLQSIQELPQNDKLMIMEYIWDNLSQDDAEFESPEWHKSVLMETEKRFKEGKEEIIDWDEARKQLRKTFE